MSDPLFPPLRVAELTVDVDYFARQSVITVRFAGNADLKATDAVRQLIGQVHPEAQRLAVTSVRVDFRELEFMNSSCLKAFVIWLQALQEDESGHRYRIVFQADAARYWQERSLSALSCLAPEWVDVE